MRLRGEGQVREGLENALLAQREHMFCWVPVCLAVGIGLYFSLGQEPGIVACAVALMAVVVLGLLSRLVTAGFAPLVIALCLVLAGAGLAKYRVEAADAPVLGFRYYGPIQGRLIHLDRSSSDALRLTLDQVVLARMSPERTPARVRVSLHGQQNNAVFQPGDTLILTGHLSPPLRTCRTGRF